MNIVYFGTSDFAGIVLRRLIESSHKILAVVTQPDRKRGRSLRLSPSPAKVLALEGGIPVHQPADISNPESINYLKTLGADLFVVVSFGQFLSREALAIPKLCSVNLHTSLLPKYRGAAPINWSIINGDDITGVTVIRLNERMDEGDIAVKREVGIDKNDTSITLGEKLSDMGSAVLLEAIDLIGQNKVSFVKQYDKLASYAPKLKKENGLIDWNSPAIKIHNMVRGLLPWPGAYTHVDKMILKIMRTEVPAASNMDTAASGEVIDIIKDKGLLVKTGEGELIITHLQLEGKKVLDAEAFLRGHRIVKGYRFQ